MHRARAALAGFSRLKSHFVGPATPRTKCIPADLTRIETVRVCGTDLNAGHAASGLRDVTAESWKLPRGPAVEAKRMQRGRQRCRGGGGSG